MLRKQNLKGLAVLVFLLKMKLHICEDLICNVVNQNYNCFFVFKLLSID